MTEKMNEALADVIYHGGSILTMADEAEQVEAVAVAKGRILAAGDLAKVMACKGANTRVVDLAGKTLFCTGCREYMMVNT